MQKHLEIKEIINFVSCKQKDFGKEQHAIIFIAGVLLRTSAAYTTDRCLQALVQQAGCLRLDEKHSGVRCRTAI